MKVLKSENEWLLYSPSMEVTGKSHLSSGEASADLQEILQSLDIDTDVNEKFGTTNCSV